MSDVTQLLLAMDAGDPKVAVQLLPVVYVELRKLPRGEDSGRVSLNRHEIYRQLQPRMGQTHQMRFWVYLSPRDALQSAYMVKVCVTAGYRQMVLPAECGNPDVVLGNGSRRRTEFLPNIGVMVRCFCIDLGDGTARFHRFNPPLQLGSLS